MTRVIAGLLLVLAGLATPAWFRSVSRLELEVAADRSSTLAKEASLFLAANRVGTARLLDASEATLLPPGLEAYGRQNPPPFYASHQEPDWTTWADPFLDSGFRGSLRAHLSAANRPDIARLLRLGARCVWHLLKPVGSPAGVPLEIALGTTALLLLESGADDPVYRDWVTGLPSPDEPLPPDLEPTLLAVAALARDHDFDQLATLHRLSSTRGDLTRFAQAGREKPERREPVFRAAVLARDLGGTLDFLERAGPDALAHLRLAIGLGAGAVSRLVESADPVGSLPPVIEAGTGAIVTRLPRLLVDPLFSSRATLLILKSLFLYGGAFFLVRALGERFSRASEEGLPGPTPGQRILRSTSGAFLLFVVLWFVSEPSLLRQPPPTLSLAGFLPPAIANTNTPTAMPSPGLDTISLLLLGLFFVLQGIIYLFCLIKLSEIRRKAVDAETKIRLVDNEENLFDSGLYLGLGGTVVSLLLIAMNIVEASLMAAYASTLFGILFVSLLKILHVRPFKRYLILNRFAS